MLTPTLLLLNGAAAAMRGGEACMRAGAGPTPSIKMATPFPVQAQTSRRAVLSTLPLLPFVFAPTQALAEVKGANQNMPRNERDISAFLVSQGFAPLGPVPSGLSPLVQYIGTAPPANIDGFKVRERAFSSTLLVRFFYPSGWLVETPTLTENGEAGKIAANNYQKGDAADFVALKLPEGQKLTDLNKEFFKSFLSTQMSNDVYEDVKIKKLKSYTAADGSEMVTADFTYTLLTRAGFTVNRKGVASAMIAKDTVVGLVLATTEQRFKDLENNFRQCAESFRAYAVKKPAFAFAS